jgi:hypothetical protein
MLSRLRTTARQLFVSALGLLSVLITGQSAGAQRKLLEAEQVDPEAVCGHVFGDALAVRRTVVLSSDSARSALCAELKPDSSYRFPSITVGPSALVDFAREHLLFIGLGMRRSICCTVRLDSLVERDSLRVYYTERRTGCPAAQAISYPTLMARIPVTSKPAAFIGHSIREGCEELHHRSRPVPKRGKDGS